MSTNTTNKRKRITINTEVAIANAVHKQEKSILTLKMISHNQCCLPTIKTPHSSLFLIMGITTTLAITTLLEKNKSCRDHGVPLYTTEGAKISG